MIKIESIHIYPVKSCKGIELQQAELTETGLAHDREWVIVSPDGRFVTQRQLPKLALIHTELGTDRLTLRSPNYGEVNVPLDFDGTPCQATVWNDTCAAIDQGADVAKWLSGFAGQPLRLARFSPTAVRISDQSWTSDIQVKNKFSDDFQLLITSVSSLADLNAKLDQPLPMNRFRPNFVISGLEAFDEDYVNAADNGDIRLWFIKPCARCEVTTTNQDTSEVGYEPLQALSKFRLSEKLNGGVAFGVHGAILSGCGAMIEKGAMFTEEWAF